MEKLSVASPVPGALTGVPNVTAEDVVPGSKLLPPLSIVLVKGWSRSCVACAIMACCYEMPEFLEVRWHHDFQALVQLCCGQALPDLVKEPGSQSASCDSYGVE